MDCAIFTFYESNIEYINKFRDFYRPLAGKEYTDIYYNIHSMPIFKEYMEKLEYIKFDFMKYEIDIDIPKTDSIDIGTYTVKIENGKRIQISVGLMMPWYFIVASK